MKNLIKNKIAGFALLGGLLLTFAPMSLLVDNIDLLSEVSYLSGGFFTLLTDSAGSKGFLISLAVLVLFSAVLLCSKKEWLAKGLQLVLILLIGFSAKTGLKLMTESPRPYTELLSQQLLIPHPDHFYNLNIEQQAKVISEVSPVVSSWRSRHWQGEKDYSFPSGHTIFAAICLAFFGNIFLTHKRFFATALLLGWAFGVAYSRLWLGMHRPIDVVGSVMFVVLAYALLPSMGQLSRSIISALGKFLPSYKKGFS